MQENQPTVYHKSEEESNSESGSTASLHFSQFLVLVLHQLLDFHRRSGGRPAPVAVHCNGGLLGLPPVEVEEHREDDEQECPAQNRYSVSEKRGSKVA